MAYQRFFLLAVFLVLGSVANTQIGIPSSQPIYSGAINRTVLKARRALVTSMLGTNADRAKVSGGDQESIAAVEDMLRAWKRYQLTRTEEDADLMFAVRKRSRNRSYFWKPAEWAGVAADGE